MSFNLNFFKGSTMNQVQNALQYWTNGLISSEEADKLKADKEKEILANVVIEGVEDEPSDVSASLLCQSKEHPRLYE